MFRAAIEGNLALIQTRTGYSEITRHDIVNLPHRFSLKRRTLSAGSWSLGGYALSSVIRLASSLLLTRLLIPQMFGVMAIASIVMTGLAMFSDLGLAQNIIQSKRGNDPAFLNTAWVIQIIRGVLLWLFALCISFLLSAANHTGLVPKGSVYSDPYLPYVIAAVSISAVIAGFQSTKFAEASRRLLLSRVTQIQIAAQIIGLICIIGWVLIDRSIWALVAGYICGTAATTVLSHTWLPGITNRWQWDQSAFQEIVHFGKWMFLSSILGFFANNGDRMLLGGFVDSATLGVYGIAYNIFSVTAQVVNRIISDVGYSALSEVAREQSVKLKHSYYKLYAVIASFTYFCAGFLMISGHNLVSLLYDQRYVQAGWMLEVLAVSLPSLPISLAYYCLLALGRSEIFANLIAINVAALLVFIPVGFHFFGVLGALCGLVASLYLRVPATIYYQVKYGFFDLPKELLLLPTLCAGMVVAKGFNLTIGH